MKKILLAVTGSISAYKAADLVSQLKKQQHDVTVIMTPNATKFITPLTLATLSEHGVGVNMMDELNPNNVQHIKLAQECDAFVVAPASANTIAKLAMGVGDNMVTTTVLALPKDTPKWFAPAMNTMMYQNPQVQANIKHLKELGYQEILPRSSRLACGVEGLGALASIDTIMETILND